MTLAYRILSLFINLVGCIIAVSLVFALPLSLVAPVMWLGTFVIAAVVLYTWFSYKFRRKVLVHQQPVKRSLYDWIRVNGIVAIVFCFLQIPAAFSFAKNPTAVIEAMKPFSAQYGKEFERNVRPEMFVAIGTFMLVYLICLLIHVMWTFALMRKCREFFQ